MSWAAAVQHTLGWHHYREPCPVVYIPKLAAAGWLIGDAAVCGPQELQQQHAELGAAAADASRHVRPRAPPQPAKQANLPSVHTVDAGLQGLAEDQH